MAAFNPQVQPTQDPNYLNYSRPVDAPSPDSSAAQIFKTLGEGLEGAVQVIDTSIKAGIKDRVYKEVDPKRDEMTSALEKIKGQVDNQSPAPVQKVAGASTSWLDANAMADSEDAVPEGINQGLDKVSLLTQARAAAKINDTQYSGEVLAIAKQLRATYGPGYREYIDQQISTASGLPVANSYYQNLMTDINRQLGNIAKNKDGVDSLVQKNLDVPGIVAYWQQYKADPTKMPEAVIIQKIADHQQMMNQFKIDGYKRAASTDDKKVKIEDTTSSFTKTTNDFATRSMSDIIDLSGSKASDLVTYFQDVASGKIQQTDEQINQRRAQLSGYIAEKKNAMWALATEGGRNSVAATIGNKEAENIIDNSLFSLRTVADLAGNKDSGLATFHARGVEAIKGDAQHNFLINKDTGAESRQLYGARSVIGDQYMPAWITNMVSKDVDQKYKNMFNQEAMSAVQPYTDVRGQSIPRYMKTAIEHAKEVGAPSSSGVYGALTSVPTWITDPKLSNAAKDRIIDWGFNPTENKGVLDNLKPDYVDPATNKLVPGKHTAFNNLASPAMVQAVAETARSKPENYVKYQTTLEGEFSTILRTDVQNINKVVEKVPGTGYAWDDKANKLYLIDKTGKPIVRNERYQGITNPNGVYLNGVLDQVDRINEGLGKLSYVQQNNPAGAKDTSLYVFNVLRDNRANEAILKAIVTSRNPETTPVQTLNYTRENKGPSVSEFVSNPTGAAELQPQPKRGVVKGNLSDEQLLDIKVDAIPENMSARDFIRQLKDRRSDAGNTQVAANITNTPGEILEGLEGTRARPQGYGSRGGPTNEMKKQITGYHIWDNQNRDAPISNMYKPDQSQRRRAHTRAEKMNLEYGAHRYSIRPVWEDVSE